ncbi:MAG: hypothetical protein ACRDA3_03470 [Peptostreptococcaceae bacterium]
MKKLKISLGVILLIVCCTVVFSRLPLDIKENSTIVDSDNKTIDNKKTSTSEEVKNDIKINSNSNKPNVSDNNANNKVTKTSDSSSNDYSVLVQSPVYDAVVQLDKESKEINVKLLNDSNLDSYDTDKYINLSEDEVNYLKENAQSLLKEFEEGSMLDKYSFVSKMLKDYDTNIKMGDLISIAMSYLN